MMFRPGRLRASILPMAAALALSGLARTAWEGGTAASRTPPPAPPPVRQEASRAAVERTCGGCHAVPPPGIFPKSLWAYEVSRGFRFLERADRVTPETPSFGSVVDYFRNRAPEELPNLRQGPRAAAGYAPFRPLGFRLEGRDTPPGIANVRFARLSDPRRLDVIACDMINGLVLLLDPGDRGARARVLCEVIPNPAHAEVCDLDGDGRPDLIVGNLGSPLPTEERVGSVFWLRGRPDGTFAPLEVAAGLGRVADVQAADFDGDGDLDLVVAAFGRREVGGVVYLENRPSAGGEPSFAATILDDRAGAIHVPVADLNGDGRPDFVALVSQEHERVEAFLNEGGGRFRTETIYAAPHPAFGSSGIELVDLDGDGDRDVLMSNGDSMDTAMLRPYHGVQWLENRGSYPFAPHRIADIYGAQRAAAGDVDGDGDLDIVATCFLPGSYYEGLARERGLDSIVLLVQAETGRFVRRVLEKVACHHLSCDLGDLDGDGRLDLVLGNAFIPYGFGPVPDRSSADWVTVLRNVGPTPELSRASGDR